MTALQTAVLDLADARDFAFAGGKAVNLAELLGAGFPVPDGFCVGTPAYAQAAETAGIDAVLDAGTDLAAGPAPPCSPRRSPPTSPTPSPRPTPRSATACRSRCGRRPRPRTCPSPASPASRTPTSTWSAPTRCWTPCGGAGRRCGPTGPWPTAPPTGIDHAGVRLAVVVQRMVDAAGRRACCSPPTRSPGGAAAAVIDAEPRPGRGGRLRRGQPGPLRGRHDRASARRRLGDKRV